MCSSRSMISFDYPLENLIHKCSVYILWVRATKVSRSFYKIVWKTKSIHFAVKKVIHQIALTNMSMFKMANFFKLIPSVLIYILLHWYVLSSNLQKSTTELIMNFEWINTIWLYDFKLKYIFFWCRIEYSGCLKKMGAAKSHRRLSYQINFQAQKLQVWTATFFRKIYIFLFN